ncbi:MAG TPA: HAD family hydrolase [Roseiflexaceae bacterium]|nr:HAD family hydrolase [Roseiflexaceae bacterium]
MPINAVVFDRDHTLIQPSPAAITAFERHLAQVAPALPFAAVRTHWQDWPGPWPVTPTEEPGFWDSFWDTLARRHHVPAEGMQALRDIGAFYHTTFEAYPDALPCLAALRAQGLRLAVLTDFELPSIDLTLRHAGIDPAWFDVLINSSMLGAQKPNLKGYQTVLGVLGLPAEQCLFVDDKPANVRGALQAGMHGVVIDRDGRHTGGEVARVGSLSELPALVGSF